MVNSTHTISQSVVYLSTLKFLIYSNKDTPWLCPLQFGGMSLVYTVYRLAGKYSEDDIEGSSQVSVPIMMSGFVVLRSKSSSVFLSIENSR